MSEIAGILANTAVLLICCGVAFYYNDPDDLRIRLGVAACLKRLVLAVALAPIVLIGLHAISPAARFNDAALVASVLLLALLVVPLRSAVFSGRRARGMTERVLILGASELTLRIINEIDRRPDLGYEIVGIIDDSGDARLARDGRLIGPLADISRIVEETRAQRVIVALAERRGRLPVGELLDCQRHDVVVEDGVQAYERLTGSVPIEWIAPSQLLFGSEFPRVRRKERVAHACMRALAFVALILAGPVLLIIGALIRLQSSGPVLHVEERLGLLGRRFGLLAFRATPHTRVGRCLQTLGLHRLPLLINLVRGDLALVGPRPLSVASEELLTRRNDYAALRHRVRPGLTGWAQVCNADARSVDDASHALRLDLYYIKHRSWRLDLHIVLETLQMMRIPRKLRAHAAAQRGLAPGRS